MITISNFPRGARGLRLMWQCEEMGLAYEVEKIAYPPSEAYRAKNPLGSVPFLEDGSDALNESVAIMLFLAQKYGPTPLLPKEHLARVLQITVFSEATFGAGLNTLMTAHFGAPDADKQNWSVRTLEQQLKNALGYIESLLGDRSFFAGDDLTLADIAITTSLGVYKGALGKPLSDRLVAYRERLAERATYKRALERAR